MVTWQARQNPNIAMHFQLPCIITLADQIGRAYSSILFIISNPPLLKKIIF